MRHITYIFLLVLFNAPRLQAGVVTVYVYNVEFSLHPPGEEVNSHAVITQGDTIRWLWVQGGHTTTSVAGSPEAWDQSINSSNTEFQRVFHTAGVFIYYCIPHGTDNGDGTASGMWGSVTVLAAGSGACCLPDGSCVMTDAGDCLALAGSFGGVGSLCDTTTCMIHVEVPAWLDNTLYESATGALSNGAGEHVWVGNNNAGHRRGLIAFDLAAIPSAAAVNYVALKLYCDDNNGDPFAVTLHPVNQAWGEGTSNANGQEGSGATSTPDDATWIHTFYDTATWSVAGGDFVPAASASAIINASDTFTWNSPTLQSDVMGWIADPATNHGWLLQGDEASSSNSKRFSSRENGTPLQRPRLLVDYYIPPSGACCLPDGSCESLTEIECTSQAGTWQGSNSACGDIFCPVQLTPYIDPLPLPGIMQPQSGEAGGVAHYRILMTEQFQQLHGELPPSRVWGYAGSYPGPTIEAFRDSLVTVQWVNDLRDADSGMLRDQHVFPIDTCLHGPNETGTTPVTVVHLHGGKVAPASDGYPEETFAPGDSSPVYQYPNIQPAAMLWYHDHALGITRLNVMMGLAGIYLLRDSAELMLDLPSGEYELPLVIQDRSIYPDGRLRYHETFHDHFFGEKILVNGKVWPYHNVKQGKYRLRLLNGSNSRAYTLHLSEGLPFVQIGGDLGLLESPVILDSITLLPGERYDVIVDFAGVPAGTSIFLSNSAPAPYPGFPGVGVVPEVMKFNVTAAAGYTGPIPDTLVAVPPLLATNADEERLFELLTMTAPPCGEHSHPMWTINGLMWDDITEFPVYGSTEIWTWHNQTGIAHPMHMHLVAFQVLDRQAIDESTGQPVGPVIPPESQEKGWKDTANCPPGYRTRVIARFNGFTGLYPYHCHIREHEDHEMMRQFEVRPCQWVTTLANDGPGSLRYAIDCAAPGDTITFDPAIAGDTIHLSDSIQIGKAITILQTGSARITIDASMTEYLLHVTAQGQVHLEGLDLLSGSALDRRGVWNEGETILRDVTVYDTTPGIGGSPVVNEGFMTFRGVVLVKPDQP